MVLVSPLGFKQRQVFFGFPIERLLLGIIRLSLAWTLRFRMWIACGIECSVGDIQSVELKSRKQK
jgi:hypothetical protein